MHLEFDTINEAFRDLVSGLHTGTIKTNVCESRFGEVIRIPGPLVITYNKPQCCVLFNQARDANPYFHLYEALWLIAGREDVAPLQYYISTIGQFSDDGVKFHGAYGHRWRERFGYDQLSLIIEELDRTPNSRRCVLQMWDAGASPSDLHVAIAGGKDVPCNTSAFFEVEDGAVNITVINRSNDIVWGLCGANVVQFSMLLVYVANSLGLKVGKYHQVTANAHAYTERWYPSEWLADESPNYYQEYHNQTKLVQNRSVFDHEVKLFVEANKDGAVVNNSTVWSEPFLQQVAQPMCHAFHMHKCRDYEAALSWMKLVTDDDWARAGTMWLKKRQINWEAKQNA